MIAKIKFSFYRKQPTLEHIYKYDEMKSKVKQHKDHIQYYIELKLLSREKYV